MKDLLDRTQRNVAVKKNPQRTPCRDALSKLGHVGLWGRVGRRGVGRAVPLDVHDDNDILSSAMKLPFELALFLALPAFTFAIPTLEVEQIPLSAELHSTGEKHSNVRPLVLWHGLGMHVYLIDTCLCSRGIMYRRFP